MSRGFVRLAIGTTIFLWHVNYAIFLHCPQKQHVGNKQYRCSAEKHRRKNIFAPIKTCEFANEI